MIGTVVNEKYEIRNTLAESYLYYVFEAIEKETGMRVVVKILKEEMSALPERVRHFSEEIRGFAGLSHPALAQILDVDMHQGQPFVVTEPVEGQDLLSWIKGAPLVFSACLRVVQQLSEVLNYAAQEKVCYRSIKLSNVFRDENGKVRVLSFSHPRLKLVGGNTADTDAGIQSDLYFLGTTLFELLTGESVIRRRGGINELWDAKLSQALRVRHSELTPEQIEHVVEVVGKTLTRDLAQRFAGHHDFQAALEVMLETTKLRNTTNKTAVPKRLASAAEVVDAIQGRGFAATGTTGGNNAKAAFSMAATTASAQNGAIALFSSDSSATIGHHRGMIAEPSKANLRLLPAKNTDEYRPETRSIWRGSEKALWWRNPRLIIGVTLALAAVLLLLLIW